jgi:hypothetical protein
MSTRRLCSVLKFWITYFALSIDGEVTAHSCTCKLKTCLLLHSYSLVDLGIGYLLILSHEGFVELAPLVENGGHVLFERQNGGA